MSVEDRNSTAEGAGSEKRKGAQNNEGTYRKGREQKKLQQRM